MYADAYKAINTNFHVGASNFHVGASNFHVVSSNFNLVPSNFNVVLGRNYCARAHFPDVFTRSKILNS